MPSGLFVEFVAVGRECSVLIQSYLCRFLVMEVPYVAKALYDSQLLIERFITSNWEYTMLYSH